MDLLLILTYTAFCIAIFKIFKIPLNKWSVPTAVLGGIILIGGLVFTMNYNHPFSEVSREYYVTTPIVPAVNGNVIEVPVEANQLLMKGDVLFKLDPKPFQDKLDSIEANLVVATSDFKRAKELYTKGIGKQRDVDLTRGQVDDLTAKRELALFDLDSTIVRAPTDGYVVQQALRPGMRAVSLPLRPVMVFKHKGDKMLVGWYRQNSMLRLEKGSKAEVIFDGLPGKVFSAKVVGAIPAIPEGQIQASGTLISVQTARFPGRIPVLFEIDDPRFAQYNDVMMGGAYGQTAIYSTHFEHVAIMRKVLLRMASWMNYFFPFH
ncbi:MAG: multidrug resistance efflux pump [Moritella dasanensis]|jgi:multidrug resistance efflux pump